MAIIINSKPKLISIVQVYAPITDHSDDKVETFYEDIEKVLKTMRLDGPIYIMGGDEYGKRNSEQGNEG